MTVFNENRTYGVELEIHAPFSYDQMVTVLNNKFWEKGIDEATAFTPLRNYSHEDNRENKWKVVYDASVHSHNGNAYGMEIVSPILNGENGFEQIKAVCEALNESGCSVSRQTGMHVHHDKSDLSPKQIGQVFGTYAAFQTLLKYSVAPSRRATFYSRPVPVSVTDNGNDKWDDVTSDSQMFRKLRSTVGDRYSSVNWDSMNPSSPNHHGTIEFRQHQGTMNANKVITWVLITQAIIENAVQFKARFPKATGTGRMEAFKKGEYTRFKTFLRINPSYNNGNPNEHYVWAFKQFRKTIKKFLNGNRGELLGGTSIL